MAPARPAPVIIQIPNPPARAAKLPKIFGLIAAGEGVLGGVLFFTLPAPANYIAGGVLLFQAAIFGGIAAWTAWRMQMAAGVAPPPQANDAATDPLAEALRGEWRDSMRYPHITRLERLVRQHPPADPTRARIISLGFVDVPRVGELHFEPEIITPTRYLGRNLLVIGLGLFFIAVALVMWTRVLPFPWFEATPLLSFGYFYAMIGTLGGAWLYRSTIRPTYIRLAPGVVEILRYSFRGGPPLIHSYPVTSGTTILLLAPWWGTPRRKAAPPTTLDFGDVSGTPRRPFTIMLFRDGRRDGISFHQMRRSHEIVDRLWQSVLSTAPTPPLSRDELVG